MKNRILALWVLTTVILTACHREVRPFEGDYSYKISGEVALLNNDGTTTYRLLSKSGQMNIRRDSQSDQSNRVLVTLNEMGGSGYAFYATISGSTLTLEPHEFCTNILSSVGNPFEDTESNNTLECRISAQGTGFLQDDILVVDECWTGYRSDNPSLALSAPKMTLIAEKN